MCGPSGQEKAQQTAQSNLASTMAQDFGARFGAQAGVLTSIQNSLTPILAAGPNQTGFSAPELSAMQTQAINDSAAATRNAQQYARTIAAGEGGGGTSGLTSGIAQQIGASIASQGAQAEGNALNQITQANYNQGNQNYWRAAGGMQALAAGLSPSEFGQLATSGTSDAFNEAKVIQDQNNAEQQAIAGGLASLATSFIPGGSAFTALFPKGGRGGATSTPQTGAGEGVEYS
jgi:hypothetical protein